MSLIHEMLYANSDLSKINLADYVTSLFEKLRSTYNRSDVELKMKIPKDLFHYWTHQIKMEIELFLEEATNQKYGI